MIVCFASLKSRLALAAICAAGFTVSGVASANANSAVATKVADLPNNSNVTPGVTFSPSGDWLAVEDEPYVVKVWQWRSKQLQVTLTEPIGAQHFASVDPLSFSPDGRFLALCHSRAAGDVVIRVWTTSTWQVRADIIEPGSGGCSGLIFTPDSSRLIHINDAITHDSRLVATDTTSWQEAWVLSLGRAGPQSIAVSPSGQTVAITVTAPGVGPPPSGYRVPPRRSFVDFVNVQSRTIERQSPIRQCGPISWSADGERLAVLAPVGAQIIDAKSGEVFLQGDPYDQSGHLNVRFSPSGRYFIESGMNASGTGFGVRIWNGTREKLLQTIAGSPTSLAVSKDGDILAIGAAGNTSVWKLE